MIKISFSLIFLPQLRTYTAHILLSEEDNNAMLVIVFTLFFVIPSAVRGQGRNSQRWYKYKCRLGFLKKTRWLCFGFRRKQTKTPWSNFHNPCQGKFHIIFQILEQIRFKFNLKITFSP